MLIKTNTVKYGGMGTVKSSKANVFYNQTTETMQYKEKNSSKLKF